MGVCPYVYICMHAVQMAREQLPGMGGRGGGQVALWIKAKVRAAAVAHVQGEWRPHMALH